MTTETIITTDTEITAEITGRGPDSQVRDNPGAVDAEIYADGELVGEVTLVPDRESGKLTTWGDRDHWANGDMLATLLLQDERAAEDPDVLDGRRLADEIVGAVRLAAKARGPAASRVLRPSAGDRWRPMTITTRKLPISEAGRGPRWEVAAIDDDGREWSDLYFTRSERDEVAANLRDGLFDPWGDDEDEDPS